MILVIDSYYVYFLFSVIYIHKETNNESCYKFIYQHEVRNIKPLVKETLSFHLPIFPPSKFHFIDPTLIFPYSSLYNSLSIYVNSSTSSQTTTINVRQGL